MLLAPIYPSQNVDQYLFEYYQSPDNAEQLQDPQLDAMIAGARTQPDPESMRQSCLDVQRYLAGRLYAVGGLPVGYRYTLLQPWVQSYDLSPEAYGVGRAWRTLQLVP